MNQHAGHAQVLGQDADAPVGPVSRSGFQRGVQNLLLQFRREHPTRPLAWVRRLDRRHAAQRERRAHRQNRWPSQPGLLGNGMVRHTLAGQQDHAALASDPLGRRARTNQPLQLASLRVVDGKRHRTGEHAPIRSRPPGYCKELNGTGH